MKRIELFITIFVLSVAYTFCQTSTSFPAKTDTSFNQGSNIVFSKLNEQTIGDLELLGRIWGFLKYHHPELGKGQYNWDYELFRILPNYLQVSDNNQRDKLLLEWINTFGEIPTCSSCKKTSRKAVLKPDLKWIKKSDLDKDLQKKLTEIYKNRHQGNHYYIGMVPFVGNPTFVNENPYTSMPYPDQGFRLLALYRYWNIIQYYYPNRHLTDKDWNVVLEEYIPKFINCTK